MNDIPEHIKESLDRYVDHKVPTGDFLYAVLTNDLFEAVGRADCINIRLIPDICSYMYNSMPSICWGSKEIVDKWLKKDDDNPASEAIADSE